MIAWSSSSRSWLTTSSAPRYERRKPISHSLASTSRWLVGSSSTRLSVPPNRMRASSTRRRSPPESAVSGQQGAVGGETETGEDAVHVGLGAVAARVTEGLLGVREAADRPLARRRPPCRGGASPARSRCGVEAAGREHVGHRDVLGAGAIGARILGQEAERAGDGDRGRSFGATLAAERAQQRGLARAVAADESRPCRPDTPRTTRRRRARARRFRSSVPVPGSRSTTVPAGGTGNARNWPTL